MEGGVAEAVVIGGMVLDINATPSSSTKPRTTTPGKVVYALGGVARNIAECMSKLGSKPYMISAVGLDMAGNLLLQHWESAGLSIEGIRRNNDIETAVIVHIFDNEGEVAAGVASVKVVEHHLTPSWIEKFKMNICTAPVILVDANLSPVSLEASCQIADQGNTPVWFEPVSVAKSKRVASVVKHIRFVSPNEDELIAMANALSGEDTFHPIQRGINFVKLPVESLFQELKPAIWVLLEKGIEIVIVTVGSDGIFLCSKSDLGFQRLNCRECPPNSSGGKLYKTINLSCPSNLSPMASTSKGASKLFAVHYPALSASVVRLTGAGDCFVGGTLASLCSGLDVMQSVAVGIASAKAAVEAESNVPEQYSFKQIADDASVSILTRLGQHFVIGFLKKDVYVTPYLFNKDGGSYHDIPTMFKRDMSAFRNKVETKH
ncbi:hypothetical protein Leryth_004348 [Lithospermum erythrorhizon]|nr:hypothetical protein Leryth_004348 [Lithospermum erythrorhizon]